VNSMDHRLALVALALGALGLVGCGGGSSLEGRPNVLLITIDTLRADHLHSYGFPLETSPNLDALAAESVVFERAIAAASSTAPAHASIMTSKYVREHSVGYLNGGSVLDGSTTIAEVFRGAGYRTAAFVSNDVLQRRTGLDRGFELYDDELRRRLPRRMLFERIAEDTTKSALRWLDSIGEEPFFLWVHYIDPHGPYTPPPGFLGRFHLSPAPGEQPLPVLPDVSGYRGIPDYQAIEGLSLPSEYQSRYADEILYADHWLGRLIETVDSISGETIVLVTADHGESLGENERYFVHFWSTTPENAHVPMILRAPGLPAERRRELVSHVDVMPTLLELVGLELPANLSGMPLGPHLRQTSRIPDRLVFCDVGRELSAYRGDGFVRLTGAKKAYSAPAGADEGLAFRASRYAWDDDDRWSRVASEVPLDEAIRAYAHRVTPMKISRELSPEIRERLRALGYAED
jgi:arylsulfatase A-like enzyme